MIQRYTPTLWRRRRALEQAADEILRADRQKQQRLSARARLPREVLAEEPRRYRFADLPLLRKEGKVP